MDISCINTYYILSKSVFLENECIKIIQTNLLRSMIFLSKIIYMYIKLKYHSLTNSSVLLKNYKTYKIEIRNSGFSNSLDVQ